MIEAMPAGLVFWEGVVADAHRIAVLISDVHCTDGTVGNQSADETDWENFAREVSATLKGMVTPGRPTEILFILNGDIIDLLRSGRWAENGVFPWERDHPQFGPTLRQVMDGIVQKHAIPACSDGSSGFFFYLRQLRDQLRAAGADFYFIPILGNHDKEIQLDGEVRRLYFEDCLGMTLSALPPGYVDWVAAQLGPQALTPPGTWPLLPVYLASQDLKLLATHGQWRDDTNRGQTGFSGESYDWAPARWQASGYEGFVQPCFGDTVATGLLSHFIYHTRKAIEDQWGLPLPGILMQGPGGEPGPLAHMLNVLEEMDLYRPSVKGVVRLLEEAGKLGRVTHGADVRALVLHAFNQSLRQWLDSSATCQLAPQRLKVYLWLMGWLSRFNSRWINLQLMKVLAGFSDSTESPDAPEHTRLPAFRAEYRQLGLRLHVEGHTHVALECDLQFPSPRENRNYTYINLGAWRDRILPKLGQRGYRRRGIGRVLLVESDTALGLYHYTLRDITSWDNERDQW